MNHLSSFAAVCLSVLAVAAPAHAQSPNYSVTAHAVTGGMPGAGASYVGPLAGQTSADAQHDPAAVTWAYYYTQILFADAGAYAWTDLGSLTSHVDADAQRVDATSFPSGVSASTTNRFQDRITVVSDTLPKNTPVTLTFRAALSVEATGSGLFDGRASCTVQIGASSASPKWSDAWNKAEVAASSPLVVVKTTVGATLWISGRLDTSAHASFMAPGPLYGGAMQIDATCETPLLETTPGVYLVTESGFDYASLQ
ncbi:hypothetical protein SAMN02745121_05330 [Nannocystis exedens]|uniref:Uncharacterized protein n=1 Tax=Nannocystis exedens TaxID=54 RepID=A0A1I2CY29_9BACT|nr:hypothetical protein [Nannocystis exedens]PCC68654.1 hypothetical protein NAEX_01671 [Nannocystis exedens]SFE73174.1 hypothetical protein SAMN02745121_05330 [Nannocystis exedens]